MSALRCTAYLVLLCSLVAVGQQAPTRPTIDMSSFPVDCVVDLRQPAADEIFGAFSIYCPSVKAEPAKKPAKPPLPPNANDGTQQGDRNTRVVIAPAKSPSDKPEQLCTGDPQIINKLCPPAKPKPKSEIRTPAFHDCVQVSEEGNFAGYMSEATIYQCREGKLRIEGKWGEDIQSGWSYRTKYGSLDGYGQFIGDEPLEMQMPKYQKWCKTKYGFTLCGWNDEEHNKEMERMKQDSKHPRPYQK